MLLKNKTMASIREALQNANYNLDNVAKVGLFLLPIVKGQLNNAVTLIEKGYGLETDIEETLEKYGGLDSVPDIHNNPSPTLSNPKNSGGNQGEGEGER